jgi:uncharacterized membrane protein
VLRRGLTYSGVVASWLLGGTVFSAFGQGGFLLVCLYFILGSAATKFRLKEKQAKGIAEARSGLRGVVRPGASPDIHRTCQASAVAYDPSM